MAQIDKSTIRTEVAKIKADFEQMIASGKISDEVKFLMNSMFMIMELMLSIFLEKQTRKDNKNSSIPSSQTDKDESALSHKGSNGKGKEEQNRTANNTRTKETVTTIEVYNCDKCGEDLSDIESIGYERRTKIDIIFEKVVEHVDAQIKACPSCQAKTKGTFPKDMPGVLQYGNGLKAFVINLLVCQMVALNRVQKLVKSIMDVTLCEASLLKFVLRLHEALEQWEISAKEELLKMPAMNVDETSLRVDGKKHWIHVYSSGDITLKCLHKGRGIEAINAIDIVPRYGGNIIHDCWASYFSYTHCGHGLCGSHLMRELTFIVQSNGYAWAKNMKKFLQEICRIVSASEEKKLSDQDYKNALKRFRNIMTRGQKELPPIPPRFTGKRGKIAKSDAQCYGSD
jgi:transposase